MDPAATVATPPPDSSATRRRGPRTAQMTITRSRIVRGAAYCFETNGYAASSNPEIARLAGLSAVSIPRHFPSKIELTAATVKFMLEALTHQFALNAPRSPRLDKRISGAVAALWGAFRTHRMTALLDIYTAAHHDRALDMALAPVLEAHRQGILERARILFPEVAEHPDFELVIDTIVYSMQGLVVGLFGAYDDGRHVRTFERLARREFERLQKEMSKR
ncbi:MAG: TetR/AcrR family transcriptional regulator [Polyangiales bacterium]